MRWLLNIIDRIFSNALEDLPDIEEVCHILDVCDSPSHFSHWCKNCGSEEFYTIALSGKKDEDREV